MTLITDIKIKETRRKATFAFFNDVCKKNKKCKKNNCAEKKMGV